MVWEVVRIISGGVVKAGLKVFRTSRWLREDLAVSNTRMIIPMKVIAVHVKKRRKEKVKEETELEPETKKPSMGKDT